MRVCVCVYVCVNILLHNTYYTYGSSTQMVSTLYGIAYMINIRTIAYIHDNMWV